MIFFRSLVSNFVTDRFIQWKLCNNVNLCFYVNQSNRLFLDRQFEILYNRRSYITSSHQKDSILESICSPWDVEIRETKNKGRGLFSKRNFEEDEIIFEEIPLVATPRNRKDYCGNCLRNIGPDVFQLPKGDFVVVKDEFGFGVPSSLLQHPQVKRIANHIVQCGLHSFCSQQCKIEAYEKYPFLFSEESKESQLALETLCNNTMGKAPLLIARIIGLLQSNTISSDDSLVEASVLERNHIWQLLQTLYCPSLEDTDENEPKDRDRNSPLMVSNDIVQEYGLMRKLFPSAPFFTEEFYRRLRLICSHCASLLQVQTTVHHVTTSLSGSLLLTTEFPVHGSFLPVLGTFLNHSCLHNVVLQSSSVDYRCTWIAQQPIEKGEELTISYVSTDLPVEARRSFLVKQYGFWCDCEACEYEENNEDREQTQEAEAEERIECKGDIKGDMNIEEKAETKHPSGR